MRTDVYTSFHKLNADANGPTQISIPDDAVVVGFFVQAPDWLVVVWRYTE